MGNESQKLNDSKPMIALTFDDGPTRNDKRILAALEKAGARATFFVIGRKCQRAPRAMARIAASGCEIGNHSFSHPHLDRMPTEKIREQIDRTNEIIRSFTGHNASLMRPPYGEDGGPVKPVLAEMGYASVLWSIDTLDWKTRNPINTITTILHHAADGDIILMHSNVAETVISVELMVPELVRRGFKLVTVSELASARGGMTPGEDVERFIPLP